MNTESKLALLHKRCQQLWNIAMQTDKPDAVMAIYHDIKSLLSDLHPKPGKTLCEIFAEEERKHASKDSQATTVHGDVCSQSEPCVREMPLEEGGAGVLPQAEGRIPEEAHRAQA